MTAGRLAVRLAALGMLALAPAVSQAFPLTMNLGNTSGVREFHFGHLELAVQSAACGRSDCVELESTIGRRAARVIAAASLTERARGTALLQDMLLDIRHVALAGEPRLLRPLYAAAAGRRYDVFGYWYPSGRRFLVIDVQASAAHE